MGQVVEWIKVNSVSEIPDGLSVYRRRWKQIAVLKKNGEIVTVFEDKCPHNLKVRITDDFSIENNSIKCNFHGARFRFNDGVATTGPTHDKLKIYPYQIKEGTLFINIQE